MPAVPETVPVTPRLAFWFNVVEAGMTVMVGAGSTTEFTVTVAVLVAAAKRVSPAYRPVRVTVPALSELAGMVKVVVPEPERVCVAV